MESEEQFIPCTGMATAEDHKEKAAECSNSGLQLISIAGSPEIKRYWQVAAITNFARMFQKNFDLPEILDEDIEDGCVALCEEMASQFFVDFLCGFLQSFRKTVEIDRDNYEVYLKRIASECNIRLDPRFADQNFWVLPTIIRLELLLSVCHARLDLELENPESKLRDAEADLMRTEPLGKDAKDATYWYFRGGTRLYREVPPPPEKPPPKNKKKKRAKSSYWRTKSQQKNRAKAKGKAAEEIAAATEPEVAATEEPEELDTQEEADQSMEVKTEAVEGSGQVSEGNIAPFNEDEFTSVQVSARWELVCWTEEQFTSLASELSNSKNAAELELSQALTALLPDLNKCFLEREKELRRRAVALLPRRQSSRVIDLHKRQRQINRQGQVVENGLDSSGFEQEIMNGDSELESANEQHSPKKYRRPPLSLEEQAERRRRQEVEAERRKKLLADSRAARAARRSEGLPADLLLGDDVASRSAMSGEDDYGVELEKMEDLLQSLGRHPDAEPFAEPVSTETAADYYNIVKNPMDLSEMDRKLRQGEYSCVDDLLRDFDLLCNNCLLYNGYASWYTTRVRKLSQHLQTLLRRQFGPEVAAKRAEHGYFGQKQPRSSEDRDRQKKRRDYDFDPDRHADSDDDESISDEDDDDDHSLQLGWSPSKKKKSSHREREKKRKQSKVPRTAPSPKRVPPLVLRPSPASTSSTPMGRYVIVNNSRSAQVLPSATYVNVHRPPIAPAYQRAPTYILPQPAGWQRMQTVRLVPSIQQPILGGAARTPIRVMPDQFSGRHQVRMPSTSYISQTGNAQLVSGRPSILRLPLSRQQIYPNQQPQQVYQNQQQQAFVLSPSTNYSFPSVISSQSSTATPGTSPAILLRPVTVSTFPPNRIVHMQNIQSGSSTAVNSPVIIANTASSNSNAFKDEFIRFVSTAPPQQQQSQSQQPTT